VSTPLVAPPRPPLHAEMSRPPRLMEEWARRGNRRRSWPRWLKPLLRAALFLTPIVAVGATVGFAWRGGVFTEYLEDFDEIALEAAVNRGFVVGEVLVEGRRETERQAALSALGIHRGDPLFGVDLDAARRSLESLPWVERAWIERRWPDIIRVRLVEREPLAIWQNDRKFTVIDRAGRPLADADDLARNGNKRIETLPQVVGPEAPEHVGDLLGALDAVPDIRRRFASASWVGDRRWNLRLDNGILIKLPEGDVRDALDRLSRSQAREKLFDRDLVEVDLRQADRMVLRSGASVATAGPPATDATGKGAVKQGGAKR